MGILDCGKYPFTLLREL